MALEVADLARDRLVAWAKWTVSLALGVLGAVGVGTYLDVQRSIDRGVDDALKSANERMDAAIAEFESRAEDAIGQVEEAAISGTETIAERVGDLLAELPPSAAVADATPRTVARREQVRPVGPGLSIGHVDSTAGTSCCIVRDGNGVEHILGVHSIDLFGQAAEGDPVLQPGPADGGRPTDVVARVVAPTQAISSSVPGAIARVEAGIDVYYDVPEIGLIQGTARPGPGDIVLKFGRTTGLTEGTVVGTGVAATLFIEDRPRLFQDLIQVRSGDGQAFSQGGDSGAPVLDRDGRLVGIVFAGDNAGTTYVFPIEPVLESLGVTLAIRPDGGAR